MNALAFKELPMWYVMEILEENFLKWGTLETRAAVKRIKQLITNTIGFSVISKRFCDFNSKGISSSHMEFKKFLYFC